MCSNKELSLNCNKQYKIQGQIPDSQHFLHVHMITDRLCGVFLRTLKKGHIYQMGRKYEAALTLKDFLTLGQHKRNCQLLHMHVLLEAHMPAPCFNNSNQFHPHSKPAKLCTTLVSQT